MDGDLIWPEPLNVPGYASLEQVDLSSAGVHYAFDFFRLSPRDAQSGAYLWYLRAPTGSGAYWGRPIDDLIPARLSASFGEWVGLASSVTEREAGRVTVRTPIDVTEEAQDAGLPRPHNGAYTACPVELEIERSAMAVPADDVNLPEVIMVPPGDVELDSPPFEAEQYVPGYPSANELIRLDADESFAFFATFDTLPDAAGSWTCALFFAPRGTGTSYRWSSGRPRRPGSRLILGATAGPR